MIQLPGDLLVDGLRSIGRSQTHRPGGVPGRTQGVSAHVAHGDGLTGSASGGRCSPILHLAGSDTTLEPAPDLVGGVELSPGEGPGPGDGRTRTVIVGCHSFEQPEDSLGTVGGPTGDQTTVILTESLGRSLVTHSAGILAKARQCLPGASIFFTLATSSERSTMESTTQLQQRVEAIRCFNRFYTKQIGVLREGLLDSPFSLTEARVVFELAQHEVTTATHLARELDLDPGYLSRVLRRLQQRGLIGRRRSDTDARQVALSLTEGGRAAFSELDAASRHQIEAMLHGLSPEDRDALIQAMETIESILGAPEEHRIPYILRPHQPGDMGWVVSRHGVLYNREYGWDETFEALVAQIVADFVRDFDARRERCWIAERGSENVGSVFLVEHPEHADVAKLRLLLVEPQARGLGIGRRLVQECSRFARQVGYRKITLWTNSVLVAARHIYEQEGYRLVDAQPHHSFGHDLVGETWELEL